MMAKQKAVSVSARIEPGDLPRIAESIVAEFKARKERRKTLEKHWDEIDRQLRMEPELSHKKLANGQLDPDRAWMPEVELPLQAQTLEMLTSDVRRLKFPNNRDFFQARAALTDEYLKRFNSAGSVFPGEKGKGDPNAVMNQDNADKLVQATISHWHAQYDFRGHMDQIDAQALSYGFGVGRLRKVNRRILGHDSRLTGFENQRIPVLIPRDARKVYLDDSLHALMHEGYALGPNIIQTRTMQYADLVAAAKAGGSDPKDEEGGYVQSEIAKIQPNKDGTIELVELEGDLVVDRSADTVIEQDVVVTVAFGSGVPAFVRYREGEKFSTYYIQSYHLEGSAYRYGASPLLKGMPVAKAAAQAMNRVIESGLLKNSPPVGWDKNDMALAAIGGPKIRPYALWGTSDPAAITAFNEVGGDPQTLWTIFTGLVNLYVDVTGVNPPRLGAQTKSHTTAFAKDAELSQGAIRTVDFVRSSLEGPMTRLLQLEYRMGLPLMRGRQTIYVEAWNEFVSLKRNHLPDIVKFTAIGAGAPAEEQAMYAKKLSSAQTALQIDSLAIQLGREPKIEHGTLIEQLLSEGGWTNVTDIIVPRADSVAPGFEPESDLGIGTGVPGIVSQRNAALEAVG
jgi:hypothetical protein